MTDQENNGSSSWKEWAKYVLKTLDELKEQGEKRDIILNKLLIEIRVMQTKMTMRAGLVGVIAGFLPSLGVLIYFIIKMKANGVTP